MGSEAAVEISPNLDGSYPSLAAKSGRSAIGPPFRRKSISALMPMPRAPNFNNGVVTCRSASGWRNWESGRSRHYHASTATHPHFGPSSDCQNYPKAAVRSVPQDLYWQTRSMALQADERRIAIYKLRLTDGGLEERPLEVFYRAR
jgi:hypothetical protein